MRKLGGGKKLVVRTASGDQMRTTPKNVTFETGKKVRDPDVDSIIESTLQTFEEEVAEYIAEVDLQMVWEFVKDSEEPVPAEDIAELFFADTQTAVVLAISSALRDDSVYFKERRDGFEPRSESAVEEMQRQIRIEQEKKRERDDFIADVVEVLEADESVRFELGDEKMADPTFRQRARILQKYAMDGRDYPNQEQAEELIEDIQSSLGRSLKGRYEIKAFWLFVDMGVWDEHENLELLKHNIPTDVDKEVEEAAELVFASDWEPDSWRTDLTGVLTFSIDSASTQDIDDALSFESLPGGGYRVGVHVADPSARIEAGSVLDRSARDRGTSIYLPTGNLPMFPGRVSHGPLSLVAGDVRPAMSTLIELDENFEVVESDVVASIVNVDHRLTYDQVDAILAGTSEIAGEALADALDGLSDAAASFAEERKQRGAVEIDLPELKLDIDLSGPLPVVTPHVIDAGSRARDLVSELMVRGNHFIGEFCRGHGIPMIYRSQDSPEEEVYTDELMALPEGPVREFAKIYKMKPGNITTEPQPHFGLGLPVYVQASSPIRRYGDLVCQRQIKAFLHDRELPYDDDEIMQIMATVESAASNSKRAERETQRYWTLYYLASLGAEEELDVTVLDHKDHDDSTAAVFIHRLAFKANARFRKRPPVGEVAQVRVKKAKPRQDVLHVNG
ncbi:MAG: ribonuclease catalytic domain-containing protein [Myxococcota bacterium]